MNFYRAKEEKTGIWRKGFFTRKKVGGLIIPAIEVEKEWDSGDFIDTYHIDENTLGLISNFPDKNGNFIADGDITKSKLKSDKDTYIDKVIFKNGGFFLCSEGKTDFHIAEDDIVEIEIIGNIHENSDLLS